MLQYRDDVPESQVIRVNQFINELFDEKIILVTEKGEKIDVYQNEKIITNPLSDSKIKFKKLFIDFKPTLFLNVINTGNEERINIVNWSYQDLRRMGYVIARKKIGIPFFSGQTIAYDLARETALPQRVKPIPSIPHEHLLEYDITNKRVRIVGRNAGTKGKGTWRFV